jgi:hypothetical protein
MEMKPTLSYLNKVVFEIEQGNENSTTIQQQQQSQQQQHYLHSPIPFTGYCYFCDYPHHSQHFCPLRYCFICECYGHSIKVCPQNSATGNLNWRHHIWKFSPFFLRVKKKKPSTFGSTWKIHEKHRPHLNENWRKS